jgi:hypothetical protein
MSNRIIIAGLFICSVLSLQSFAQGQGSITGKLVDSITKQPLSLATITLFNAGDTSILTYRMSTPTGDFRVPALPAGKPLRVIISFSGFSIYRNEFTLASGEQKNFGTIGLAPDARSLEEVLVTAERPPVIFRKDTIEFNSAAFSTLPTALVEDLLKKLPGVAIDAEGNIKVNERKVNRLLVDGKDFFGSDPRMATRNLPANIIDKVQVMDDKDEAELNPDKPPTDLGQVINLKLKKSIKKGWFGKAYAGAGTTERYEAGAIVNLFRDTFQVSLIGFSNNLDRSGFRLDDIQALAGFNRSGIDNYTVNERGLSVNGISFGGQGEGISKSSGTGFNLNNVLKNGLTLNTQYFFGRAVNGIMELANQQQFLGDSIINIRSRRDEVRATNTHRIGLGLRGALSKTSRLEFRPDLVLTDPRYVRNVETFTTHNFRGLLNESDNYVDQDDDGINYNHSLLYFKSFNSRKGRTFNVSNYVNYGRAESNVINNAVNIFYDANPPEDSVLDQLRHRNISNLSTSLSANWDEPLGKKFRLRINYSLNVSRNVDDLGTFNKSSNDKYEEYNIALSNEVRRTTWRNSLTPTINYNHKDVNISTYLNLLSFDIENNIGKGISSFEQHYKYVLPGASVRWRSLSLNFGTGASPPGLTDIQPVPDNTNPLFITYGNPELNPTINGNLGLSFVKPMPAKFAYFSTSISYGWRRNAVVRIRTIKPDGVQESRPINVDGMYNFGHSITYRRQHKFGNNKFNFFYGLNFITSLARTYLFVNQRDAYMKNLGLTPSLNGGFNWRDILEASINYSYRRGRTFYETQDFKDLDINTAALSGEFIVRWPKHFVFETQIDQRYNSQAPAGIQKTATLWNAAVNYLFLQDERGQLKFSVYDILKRNNNISRIVAENYITDRQINMLTQYFLLTFTYNIRDFKGAKVGGKQKFFFF